MGTDPSYFTGDNLPVEQVSWGDSQQFCTALSQLSGLTIRLPTEAEREYACRAGSTTRYSFGDDTADLGSYAWYDGNSNSQTHDVAGKLPNAWGLYDMHGNVWEWCSDWYSDTYYGERPDPDTDPSGPASGSQRVVRGGAWGGNAAGCRSANRGGHGSDSRLHGIGFRVIAGPQQTPPANYPPTADPQIATVFKDTPTVITLTGSDPDDDPLTFSIVNLLAHYDLTSGDGQTITDRAGRGNDLTSGLTAGSDSHDPVFVADGMDFDGVDDFLTGPATDDLRPEANFTISAAFMVPDRGFGDDPESADNLISTMGTVPDGGYQLEISQDADDVDTLVFRFRPKPFDPSMVVLARLDDIGFTTQEFHRVLASYEDDGSTAALRLYYDGELVDEQSFAGVISYENVPSTFIGSTIGHASYEREFHGVIRNVKVWGAGATVGALPMHGTLSGTAPDLTYTPDAGFVGTDSFSFAVNDGSLDSAPATVTIDVGS